jgi:hypothetical protein
MVGIRPCCDCERAERGTEPLARRTGQRERRVEAVGSGVKSALIRYMFIDH